MQETKNTQKTKNDYHRQTSFLVMQSWEAAFELLSSEEIAEIVMNLFRFNRGEEAILTTQLTKMMWKNIEPTLILNREKYINRINNSKSIYDGK
jgi:hypothetical protein